MQVATHRAVGGLLGMVEAGLVHAPATAAIGIVGLAYYCGGLPDLDTDKSTISTELGPFSGLVSEVVRGTAWKVREWTTNRTDDPAEDEHRETTHVVEWSGLVAGLVWFALWSTGLVQTPWWFALAVLLGSVGHLLLGDLYTHSGIPLSLAWNVCTRGGNWRRHKIALFATDSPEEHHVVMAAVRIALGLGLAWLVGLTWWPFLLAGVLAGLLWHTVVTLELHRRVVA